MTALKQAALTIAFALAVPVMIIVALASEVWDWLSNAPFPQWRV